MRALVFCLILANLLFLAWAHGYFAASPDADALRVQQQLLADQVKVVSRDEAPAAVAKKGADTCILLRDLPNDELLRVEGLLAGKKLAAFKGERTMVVSSASYWVHIPPLASKQDADNKAEELRKLGVNDLFVVPESGPNNLAISLGLFARKDAAATYLEALRSKGIKSARIAERNLKTVSASLQIYGPEGQADVLRQSVAEVLPKAEPEACPPAATAGAAQ